jgi:hypothetical protein
MDLDRILQRLPDLRLKLDARGEVAIEVNGQRHTCGPHTLRLLHLFTHPVSVQAALDRLKPELTGTQDWMLTLRTIQHLESLGVLIASPGETAPGNAGFDRASLQIALLNDRTRTDAFLEAIRRTVHPGDVVVDLGTGTGVLAVAAAQAGARRVFALEAGRVADHAERIIQKNLVGDRVSLIRGWSTQVELPEPADVLVGELLGNEAGGEDIADAFQDAIRRFLKPGGRVIPAKVETLGRLVNVPDSVVNRHQFSPAMFADWADWYQIRFDALPVAGAAVFTEAPCVVKHWPSLSDAVRLRHLNLTSGGAVWKDDPVNVKATADGLANGLAISFRARLAAGIELCTEPLAAAPGCHWRNVVVLRTPGCEVTRGTRLRLVGGADPSSISWMAG